MTTEIQIARDGGVQVVRINRPEKKNAITGAMYKTLIEALKAGDADPGIAAHVFLGSGSAFCAGNDIGDFLASAQTGNGGPVLGFIAYLPKVQKPVVAGVTGLAIGIGVTMLFHCDLVYASPDATFTTPFLNLGLLPEAGSSLLGPRLMGHQRAFEMLVLGETFSAERARQAGLVNDIVAADALEAKAISVAERLATKPPEALALSRRLLKGDVAEISERVAEEVTLFGQRLSSPEAREAFQAFLEKRAPNFAELRVKN